MWVVETDGGMNVQIAADSLVDDWAGMLAESEAKPGWLFRRAGARLLAAVTPWPDYGETGAAVWRAKVVRVFDGRKPTRRYWLRWSSRLHRWIFDGEFQRMQHDLAPDELLELEAFMRDTLEGSLS